MKKVTVQLTSWTRDTIVKDYGRVDKHSIRKVLRAKPGVHFVLDPATPPDLLNVKAGGMVATIPDVVALVTQRHHVDKRERGREAVEFTVYDHKKQVAIVLADAGTIVVR